MEGNKSLVTGYIKDPVFMAQNNHKHLDCNKLWNVTKYM